MKWIKLRDNFLKEAKIKDVIYPRQEKEVKKVWGEKYLEYEEIEPTENIKQGVWKLEDSDKRLMLSTFFGVSLDEAYEKLAEFSDKFVEILKKSIDLSYIKNEDFRISLENFEFKTASINQIYVMYEAVFRKLSVNETNATEMIERGSDGRPLMDSDGKIKKIKKEKGDPIFSTNLTNITSFIEDYNRCYPDDKMSGDCFTVGSLYKIRGSATDAMANEYKIDFDFFEKDMFLSILHNPKDILNMSISRFYASCQHLYTGSHRDSLLGNVFDPNSIPAYIKFDTPIMWKGEEISHQVPLCRMMIRNIENFDNSNKDIKLYFDRSYPDKMKNDMSKIIEKYSGNKNSGGSPRYSFTPDIGWDDSISPPYMDYLSIDINKYVGVNTKTLFLSQSYDWSKIKISPKSKIKELIIDTVNIPKNLIDLNLNLDWVKFRFIQINTLKDFNMKTDSIAFDKCKFNTNIFSDIKIENIKKLQIIACDVDDLDISIFKNLDELQMIYTLDTDSNLEEIIGDINIGKLVLSSDMLSNKENKIFINSLKKKGVKVEIEGPKI